MASILQKTGDRIRKIRLAAGISQEKLASLTKLHRTYISDVERGNRNISIINLEKISKALGASLSDLFR